MSSKESENLLVGNLAATMAEENKLIEPEPKEWEPTMGPSQRKFFYDGRKYVLAHAERGSGKTVVAIHKMIRHCYLNNDALAMIVTITKATATGGGCWDDLTNESLFVEGPLAGTAAGMLAMWRDGIDLEYSEPYEDGAHNKYIDIRNIHGGISRIMLKSMPVGAQIQSRIKGQHPSFFLFEELTATQDPHYFTKVIQQLGRRRTVKASEQQYVATCNPANEGERHWVWKQFLEDIGDPEHDSKYGVHHIPMSENDWMPDKEGYLDTILQECKYDPSAADRLIKGDWVERLIGEGLFEGFWLPEIHIRPKNAKKGHGLVPFENEMLTFGFDAGTVNNCQVIMQHSFIEGMWRWRILDEIVNIGKRLTDPQLVHKTMERMNFWNDLMDHSFPYEHIADNQVLTHFNPSGSYIYREWAKISHQMIRDNDRYHDLPVIRMKSPPKGSGSIEERVKGTINKLSMEQLLVSPTCTFTIEMFNMIRRARDKHGNDELFKPLKTAKGHIHMFDAISYVIYYYDLLRTGNRLQTQEAKSEPTVLTFS
jgi:phage terminase large subunit